MDLETKLTSIFRILPQQEKALKKIGIESIQNLLYYFPRSYGDTSEVSSIEALEKGQSAVIFGTISGLKTKKAFRKKIPMAEAVVKDETGSIKIIWFHQAYLAKMIVEGSLVRVEGKVSERNSKLYFSNPKIERAPTLFASGGSNHLYPIYPETRGVTSNWLYHKIQKVLTKELLEKLVDPIPEEVLQTYKLPNLKTALVWLHTLPHTKEVEVEERRQPFDRRSEDNPSSEEGGVLYQFRRDFDIQ